MGDGMGRWERGKEEGGEREEDGKKKNSGRREYINIFYSCFPYFFFLFLLHYVIELASCSE